MDRKICLLNPALIHLEVKLPLVNKKKAMQNRSNSSHDSSPIQFKFFEVVDKRKNQYQLRLAIAIAALKDWLINQ